MGGLFVVIALAVVAAFGVIVLANQVGGGGDVRTFWADLRSGLRRRGAEDDAVDDEPEPVDVPFDRFFAEAPQVDDGYLQLDELAGVLERTGERASHLREHLPSGRDRSQAAGTPADGSTAASSWAPERPGAADAPDVEVVEVAAAPARVPRRSGHTPGTVVVGPPVVPPQRRAG